MSQKVVQRSCHGRNSLAEATMVLCPSNSDHPSKCNLSEK